MLSVTLRLSLRLILDVSAANPYRFDRRTLHFLGSTKCFAAVMSTFGSSLIIHFRPLAFCLVAAGGSAGTGFDSASNPRH